MLLSNPSSVKQTLIGILLGKDYPKDATYAKNVKMKDRKLRFLINIIMKQQK